MQIESQSSQVVLSGRLDGQSAGAVRSVLHEAINDAVSQVFVYARDLQIRDAPGLGVIVGAHRRAERSGKQLVLVDPSLNVKLLLARTGMHKLLVVVEGGHVPMQRVEQFDAAGANQPAA